MRQVEASSGSSLIICIEIPRETHATPFLSPGLNDVASMARPVLGRSLICCTLQSTRQISIVRNPKSHSQTPRTPYRNSDSPHTLTNNKFKQPTSAAVIDSRDPNSTHDEIM